jgi:hypothetical protein
MSQHLDTCPRPDRLRTSPFSGRLEAELEAGKEDPP